jgi:tetratricopeptide (TPR) repeat protein
MSIRFVIASLLLAALALPAMALPAMAQSPNEALCANRSGFLARDQVMAACNALAEDTSQRDSLRARALTWRGIAQRRAGDSSAAMADFTQALALDADNFDALLARGRLHYEARENQAALNDLNRAATLDDKIAALYLLRSAIHLEMRNYPAAIADADFERGGGAAFLNQRCWTRAVAGVELDKARLACDQALWAQPDAPPILDSRGVVGLKQKRFQAAWNDFGAVVKTAPRNARALYGRGLAAIGLGREAEGRADIAAAENINRNIATAYAGIGIPAP